MTMKRKSWQDYQKEIADDRYYYARSCIRQNFFPGSEKLFIDMLHNDLGKDLLDDPKHSSCTGIGYHSDIVPLETIMTVVARQFALMNEAGYENLVTSCITSFGVYTEILATWNEFPETEEKARENLWKATKREFRKPASLAHTSDVVFHFREEIAVRARIVNFHGLSSHADRDGLLRWIEHFSPRPRQVFVVHGDQEVTEVYANTLREKGLAAHAPNYEEVYDLLDNQMLSPGLPPEKKPEPASGGSPAYQRLEDVGRRLMEVIAHNKGGTNKDLGRFADQLRALIEKWDR